MFKIKTTRDQVNLVLVYTKNTINAKCTYFDLIKNKKFKGARTPEVQTPPLTPTLN